MLLYSEHVLDEGLSLHALRIRITNMLAMDWQKGAYCKYFVYFTAFSNLNWHLSFVACGSSTPSEFVFGCYKCIPNDLNLSVSTHIGR